MITNSEKVLDYLISVQDTFGDYTVNDFINSLKENLSESYRDTTLIITKTDDVWTSGKVGVYEFTIKTF